MSTWYLPRCWCGCAEVTHRHFRPGRDCGFCGAELCYGYARCDRPMPTGHARAAELSDAALFRRVDILTWYLDQAPPRNWNLRKKGRR